ncbi:1-phosphofructokinase [Bacillus sp. FJAT-44742]|uniref:1-phosphofructokinase n=1 Tax=Bacillus sp. FJAT-44742 TaxID=2014005 RepID=UPI000C249270|nr:1-phosphofructokinase [Bacillus sp. FJAT-44742]
MIYTLTLNPAVDYIVNVSNFEIGQVNRASKESKFAGGKGINVSRVLTKLEKESTALGFIGGFTGQYIQTALDKEKIPSEFIQVNGDTRINMKLKTEEESEINGISPAISDENINSLKEQLGHLNNTDMLVLAGSVPDTVSSSIYTEIIDMVKERNVKVFVDTSGPALNEVMKTGPFFIKPNHHELAELLDVPVNTVEEAAHFGKKALEKWDITHLLISMAGKGAVYISKNELMHATVPSGNVVNSVGAGDSMVAGFIAGFEEGLPIEEVLATAVAAGSGTAFSNGFCTKDLVHSLKKNIKITSLQQ